MQTVIAGYQTFSDARRAVQSLERRGLYTQDIVISDQKLSIGPKHNLTGAQKKRWGADIPRYLVAMRAKPEVIASATEMLLKE